MLLNINLQKIGANVVMKQVRVAASWELHIQVVWFKSGGLHSINMAFSLIQEDLIGGNQKDYYKTKLSPFFSDNSNLHKKFVKFYLKNMADLSIDCACEYINETCFYLQFNLAWTSMNKNKRCNREKYSSDYII